MSMDLVMRTSLYLVQMLGAVFQIRCPISWATVMRLPCIPVNDFRKLFLDKVHLVSPSILPIISALSLDRFFKICDPCKFCAHQFLPICVVTPPAFKATAHSGGRLRVKRIEFDEPICKKSVTRTICAMKPCRVHHRKSSNQCTIPIRVFSNQNQDAVSEIAQSQPQFRGLLPQLEP